LATDLRTGRPDLDVLAKLEFPIVNYEVAREKIGEYVAAIGDRNPLHHDPLAAQSAGYRDLIAPPTFAGVFAMLPFRRALRDPEWVANSTIDPWRRPVAPTVPGAYTRPELVGVRQPDDSGAARSGEAGCRAGREPAQTPPEPSITKAWALSPPAIGVPPIVHRWRRAIRPSASPGRCRFGAHPEHSHEVCLGGVAPLSFRATPPVRARGVSRTVSI
jgi:hypothetical protein